MPVTTRSGKTYTSTSSKKKTKKKTPTKSKTPTTPMRKKIAKKLASAAAKSARTRKAQQTIRSKKSTIPTKKDRAQLESLIDNTTGIAQDVTKHIIMGYLDFPKDIKTYREGQLVNIFLSDKTKLQNGINHKDANNNYTTVGKIIKRQKVNLDNQRGYQYRYVVLACKQDRYRNCEETFLLLYSDDLSLLDNKYAQAFTNNKYSIVTPMGSVMRGQGREIQYYFKNNEDTFKSIQFQNKMITQLNTNLGIHAPELSL